MDRALTFFGELPFAAAGFGFGDPVEDGWIFIDTGSSIFKARYTQIDFLFPRVTMQMLHVDPISIPYLTEQIWPLLRSFRISYGSATKALRTLFGLLKRRHTLPIEALEMPLIQRLRHLLFQDREFPMHRQGLHRSRTQFLTLAFFARWTDSTVLAMWLVNFFFSHWKHIIQHERTSLFLHEWGVAIAELQGLVSPAQINECMRCLLSRRKQLISAYDRSGFRDARLDVVIQILSEMGNQDVLYDPYEYEHRGGRDRGRTSLMPGYHGGPRSHTMPPRIHIQLPGCRGHVSGMGMDSRMLLPTPMASPARSDMALTSGAGYFPPVYDDEVVQDLALQQDILAQRVDALEGWASNVM